MQILVARPLQDFASCNVLCAGHHHSPWVPLLFIPTTGSSFHCVHTLFLCFIVCLVLLGMDGGTSSDGTANVQEIATPNGILVSLLSWVAAALSALLSLQHVAGMSPMLEASWHEKSCLTMRTPDSQAHCTTLCPTFPCARSSVSTAVLLLSPRYPTTCSRFLL